MKQKIFMYLFFFTLLLVVFQYVNATRIYKTQEIQLNNYRAKLKTYKDSISSLNDDLVNKVHFDLNRNEDAISYFEKDGIDVSTLIPFIKDELYKLNEKKGQHPIVPYASSEGNHMLINTVKILNHKWIIADFSDGEYWGELFITYTVGKNKQVSFNLEASFLYPFN